MFITLEQTIKLIQEGKLLHIAADDSLLKQLPKGNWIGGTTPYFITEQGGIFCKDKLYVDEIGSAADYKTKVYDKSNVLNITEEAYANGLTILLMPFSSEVAVYYSKEAPNSDDILMHPIVGWITGFDLSSDEAAKVYDGFSGMSYADKAVVLHICLPDNKMATLGIVNIFDVAENSSKIEFLEDTLSVGKCLVDGQETVFADYIRENNIDTQLPLIADYNGVSINVSIKSISQESGRVELYAPVFAGKEYRFACPVSDYAESFTKRLQDFENVTPAFSCNCILNYLYGKLDDKITPPFAGPVTFGEIAYQLLNQTLVYAQII